MSQDFPNYFLFPALEITDSRFMIPNSLIPSLRSTTSPPLPLGDGSPFSRTSTGRRLSLGRPFSLPRSSTLDDLQGVETNQEQNQYLNMSPSKLTSALLARMDALHSPEGGVELESNRARTPLNRAFVLSEWTTEGDRTSAKLSL